MYLHHMVEVFKTNIPGHAEFEKIIGNLGKDFPESIISFDGEDCDKVVRVEGENNCVRVISILIKCWGYQCEILD